VVAEEATTLDSARDGLPLWRVGMKKRAFRSNKKTNEGRKMGRSAETS
jgi:hypothetical protein